MRLSAVITLHHAKPIQSRSVFPSEFAHTSSANSKISPTRRAWNLVRTSKDDSPIPEVAGSVFNAHHNSVTVERTAHCQKKGLSFSIPSDTHAGKVEGIDPCHTVHSHYSISSLAVHIFIGTFSALPRVGVYIQGADAHFFIGTFLLAIPLCCLLPSLHVPIKISSHNPCYRNVPIT